MFLSTSNDKNFMQQAVRDGYLKYFQPSTVTLPSGIVLNSFGWIDAPTSGDIVIDIAKIAPDEQRTIYWFSEKIVCNSSSDVRMSLEGNLTWDDTIGDFDENGWFTQTGYVVSVSKDHQWVSNIPLKTGTGEALRLRIYSAQGNNNDLYFKFICAELPWRE